MTRQAEEFTRIAACAEHLREREDLGPAEFRHAVAGWLDTVATETKRLHGELRTNYPTLPCVVAILDAIDQPVTA